MNQLFRFGVVCLLTGAVAVGALAQTEASVRRGTGARWMNRNIGGIVSDLLVLDAAKAQKVDEAAQSAVEELRRNREGQDAAAQNLSREERRARNQERIKEFASLLKDKFKPILSEQELQSIEPFLAVQNTNVFPEVRALRRLDLKEDQRAQLQPLVMNFAVKTLEQREARQNQAFSAEEEKERKALRDDLKTGVAKILSEDQAKAWGAKTQEVRDEIKKQAEERQNAAGTAPGSGTN